MKYAYEDLSPNDFEKIVALICQELLGMAVQIYSLGKDGGIDGSFEGTANCFPSKSSPWKGVTIIQAKHTIGHNKSYSEKDMLENQNSIIKEEVKKLKKIYTDGGLDNYILFANRKLTAARQKKIIEFIRENCEIPNLNVHLVGLEQLEIYMKKYPDIPPKVNLEVFGSPLIFDPEDLDNVVEALADADVIELAENVIKDSTKSNSHYPTQRTTYNEKNKLNNMSEEYAKFQRKKYLPYVDSIKNFLANPENEEIRKKYETVADGYQAKILAHKPSEGVFDKIIETILDHLMQRDVVLRSQKKLTRALIFYMYWNCDIGRTLDDFEAE